VEEEESWAGCRPQDPGQGEVDCVSGRNMQAFWLASARARQESVKSTAAKETAITIKSKSDIWSSKENRLWDSSFG